LRENTETPVSHKQRILKAASDVFLANGFEKTSTAEIARVAKVSKRELYLHFADKRALLAAVVNDLQNDMQGRMDNTWTSGGPMEMVLHESAKVIQRFILSERFGKLVRIVAAESYHSPHIAQQFFELGPIAGQKSTARYLKQQMKQGKLCHADPMKAADDFMDLVVGAQVMTGVILGQQLPNRPKLSSTRHAVEVFLKIYGAGTADSARKLRPRSTR